jgi:hypothetical protein
LFPATPGMNHASPLRYHCHVSCTPEIKLIQFKNHSAIGEASDIRRDTDGEHQKKAYAKQN